jgi:hypothetical protein
MEYSKDEDGVWQISVEEGEGVAVLEEESERVEEGVAVSVLVEEKEGVLDGVEDNELVVDGVHDNELVDVVLGVRVPVLVELGVPVLVPVEVGERVPVPVGVEVDEGVIDGVAEPSHTSPVPQTKAGLPQIKEPLKPKKVAAAPSVEHVAVAPEARVTV